MSLAVTVLGSSGIFATVERACSGYLVELSGKKLWLDGGPGTWRNLISSCDYAQLDGILVSHRHPDHTSDVFMAFHARKYGRSAPLPPIPLWGPAEALERMTAYITDLDDAFDLTEIAAGEVIDALDAKLSFVEMAHPPETVGVRIEHAGGVFAYSADTGPEADFHTLASSADLFVCEATLQDADELWEGHLRASQAARISEDVECGRLVLTHLPPGRDHGLSLQEARAASPACAIGLANDGDRLEVGS